MGKKWWDRRSAADDHQDDDYDGGDYLDDLWSRRGFNFKPTTFYNDSIDSAIEKRAEAIVTAHGMVRSFVRTFASADEPYEVVFDTAVAVAATSYNRKMVKISPAPCLDPKIDSTTAGRVLTAIAVHEASHVRYDKGHDHAVKAAFGENPLAFALSNLVEDPTIERLFVEEYPGYRGIFEPAIKYVADALLKPVKADANPVDIAIAASRYDAFVQWPKDGSLNGERKWWGDWIARSIVDPSTEAHVQAVKEGLEHIGEQQAEREKAKQEAQSGQGQGQGEQGEQGEGDGQGEGQGSGSGQPSGSSGQGKPSEDQKGTEGDSDGDAEGDEGSAGKAGSGFSASGSGTGSGSQGYEDAVPTEMTDQSITGNRQPQTSQDAQPRTGLEGSKLADAGACLDAAVVKAAVRNGVKEKEIDGARAEQIVREAEHVQTMPSGMRVEHRPVRTIVPNRKYGPKPSAPRSGSAAARIRAALLASRSGSTGIEDRQARGRVDNGSVWRVAQNDNRIFARRIAADPGRYLVWLLVDRSGSMQDAPTHQCISTAKAMAEAFRYVDSMRFEIFGWTNAQQKRHAEAEVRSKSQANYNATVLRGIHAGAYRAWGTGEPITAIDDLYLIVEGGTPDSPIMEWAGQAIQKAAKPGEQPVIVVMSDGNGYGNLMRDEVAKARKAGVRVISVAIGEDLSRYDQKETYGRDYITWQGSIEKTAAPLARLLGRMVAS
jgi:hypothetical protein